MMAYSMSREKVQWKVINCCCSLFGVVHGREVRFSSLEAAVDKDKVLQLPADAGHDEDDDSEALGEVQDAERSRKSRWLVGDANPMLAATN